VSWYVVSRGAALRRRDNQIVIERDERVEAAIPATFLGSVVIDSGTRVSSEALRLLLARQVPVVVLDGRGRTLGRFQPDSGVAAELRLRQYERCLDPAARLELARPLVVGKIRNQRVLTERKLRPHPAEHRRAGAALAHLADRAATAGSIAELRGIEGAASSVYYTALRALPALAGFAARDRRSADPVNALSNYVSALLRETLLRAVTTAGLDPMLSLYHEPFRARPTLVFDLMEEWRPVVADSVVLALVSLGRVGPGDIELTEDGPRLSERARVAAVQRFHHRVHGDAGGTDGSYLDAMERQVARVVGWLRRGTPYEAYRWR
jgi:CRISPR-associated protein Cas1